MADIEHIKLLCRGVSAWNEARERDGFVPDLTQIDIRDAVLTGANFDGTDFDGAHWSNVEAERLSARKARLNGMRTSHTNFKGSNFGYAEFKGTDFVSSSLQDTDLTCGETRVLKIRYCDCRNANFSRTDLSTNPHFYNSDLRGAQFADARLSNAEFRRTRMDGQLSSDLETWGGTLQMGGELVVDRDEWIDFATYLPSEHREDFPRILYQNKVYWINDGRWDFFISHTSADKADVAAPLADALQQLGQEVWYDADSIVLGDNLNSVIMHGIDGSRFGVLVLSKDYFGRRWTEAELDVLQHRQIFVVLHGLEPEELDTLRPGLGDKFTVSSKEGPAVIAEKLVTASQKPRIVD